MADGQPIQLAAIVAPARQEALRLHVQDRLPPRQQRLHGGLDLLAIPGIGALALAEITVGQLAILAQNLTRAALRAIVALN